MIKRAYLRSGMLAIFCGCAIFNWIAWNHAWRMTHFVEHGERTNPPESLSLTEKIPLLLVGITVPRPENNNVPSDFGLAYETVQIQSDSHILEAWLIPAAIQSRGTVILFHGYAVAKDSMLSEAAKFSEMGYSTLLVDFRGSGGSTGMETSIGYEEAKDVAAAFKFAAFEQNQFEQPIILYGMSVGGAAILRAVATEQIEPDGIIIEAVFDEMVSTVENRFDAMGIPSFPAAQVLVFWGGVQARFNGFKHNPADYAQSVEIPTLMLHGQNDPRATLEQGEHLFDQLGSPQKTMVQFSGAEHESTLQVDEGLWTTSISHFLDQVDK